MNNKTYCPMPFVTLSVNPGNYISRCMMSMTSMGDISTKTYQNKKENEEKIKMEMEMKHEYDKRKSELLEKQNAESNTTEN